MISVKHAVRSATDQLLGLYGDVLNIRLEEIFLSDDESAWCVTLSFLAPISQEETEPSSDNAAAPLSLKQRYYKTLEIDANTGNFRALKMRPVPSV